MQALIQRIYAWIYLYVQGILFVAKGFTTKCFLWISLTQKSTKLLPFETVLIYCSSQKRKAMLLHYKGLWFLVLNYSAYYICTMLNYKCYYTKVQLYYKNTLKYRYNYVYMQHTN